MAAKKTPAAPPSKKPKAKVPKGWVTLTEACILIKRPYQRARNLALMGAFGEVRYDPITRTMYISEAGIRAALERLEKLKVPVVR